MLLKPISFLKAAAAGGGPVDPSKVADVDFGLGTLADTVTYTETGGIPSAGQYLVIVMADGPHVVGVDVSATGATATELTTFTAGGGGSTISGVAYFLDATAAADVDITNNSGTGTAFNPGGVIYDVTGATATGAITATAHGVNTSGAVTATLPSVPDDHSVVAAAFLRNGGGLSVTFGGDFAAGDEDADFLVRSNCTFAAASKVGDTAGLDFSASATPSAASNTGVIAVALAGA